MKIGLRRTAALALALSAAVMGAAPARSADGDWRNLGNDLGGSQFSPLRQIDAANVAGLQVAWVHHSGDFDPKAKGNNGLEAIPIVTNGMLYYCTPFNRVFALDPATGREHWVFDPHAPQKSTGAPLVKDPRKPSVCRNVAYWQASEPHAGAACEKRIFKADFAGRVFAIDADTGASCRDFGAAKGHPGYVTQADFDNRGTSDSALGYTSGPLVIGDLVVSASGARDSLTDANDGFVRAFDVRTGAMQWEFSPIPAEHAHDTGAANVWSTMSADAQRGLVFVPTTSPSPDYYGAKRAYDIPLADSTVALSAATGQPVWHFQATHHNLFDFDLPGHALLVDIAKDGKRIPVAIQQTKQGRLIVLDRETGKLVFPVEERAVPKSDVPGEKSSPTQPMPVLPEPFSRQQLTEEDMWGLTPFDRAWCRSEFRKLRYEGPFTPPSVGGSIDFPFGGGNWGGVAYDPVTNVVVAKGSNLALRYRLIPKAGNAGNGTDDPLAGQDMVGTPYRIELGIFLSPLGIPCTPPPFGTVTAIDMSTGRIRWQVPLGQSKWMGITAPASWNWGSPNIGGPMVTAGGLVFIAAAVDGKLRALDVRTGQELWQHDLPAPAVSVPITYLAGARQFVVVSAGGNARLSHDLSDAVVAFTLPPKR